MQVATRRPDAPSSYHHGDLESALLTAALRIIEERGTEALSIREVGNEVGVSRNALYRHYRSKSALLAKVATVGFRQLQQDLSQASGKAVRSQADPLVAMSVAYVRFALSHPAHYRVMFGPFIDRKDFPDLEAAGTEAFAELLQGVRSEQAAGSLVNDDAHRLSQVIWAQVHGLAMLAINGQLAHKKVAPASIQPLVRYAVNGMRAGFGGRLEKASPRRAAGTRKGQVAHDQR